MTSLGAAVVLAGVAGLLLPAPRVAALRRLDGATAATVAAERRGAPSPLPRRLPRLLALLAVGSLLASHGGTATVLAVLAVVVGVPAAKRRRLAEQQQHRLASDVPRAADLLAGCLDAGAAPATALATVGDAVGGPVGARLQTAAAVLMSGGDLAALPSRGSVDPAERLVGAVRRAAATGAPLATAARTLAADERERARWAATERARVVGVRSVGPLAACFLPAFVLVGVVPVVAGVARGLIGQVP